VGQTYVTDLMTRMERNRKEAEKFSDLAPSPSWEATNWRIAEGYLGRGRMETAGKTAHLQPSQDAHCIHDRTER
jgi:hypothetical protein